MSQCYWASGDSLTVVYLIKVYRNRKWGLTPNVVMVNVLFPLYSIHPVLIQGETSVGKTSLVRWLAAATGNQCVRINNHEHTDIQEYIGCYSSDEHGKLVFKEGAERL